MGGFFFLAIGYTFPSGYPLNTEAASSNYGALAHHLAMRDGSYPVEKMQRNIGGNGGGESPISNAGHRDQLANRIVGEALLRRFLIFREQDHRLRPLIVCIRFAKYRCKKRIRTA